MSVITVISIILIVIIIFFVVLFIYWKYEEKKLKQIIEQRNKEVLEQANLIKSISENLPVVSFRCIAKDYDYKFSFLSAEIVNMFGYAPSDFYIGEQSYRNFIHPNDTDSVWKRIEEASKGDKYYNIEYRVYGKDKKLIWVNERGHIAIIQDGKALLIDGTIADITSRKESTEKLNESLYELEKANEELQRQTEIANKYAEKIKLEDENKSRFLANMSHEIRTPMNAIIGMSSLLYETELNTVQKKYVDIIRSSSENLLALINDILDFSKMEARKMHFENIVFKLSDSIDDIINLLSIKASEKGLYLNSEITDEVPQFLKGDPLRLRQVIVNLVSNAIKFTENGGINIKVSLINGNNQNVTIKFVVSDTGIGIEKKSIGKLFNLFVQAEGSTARKYGGTGLGLAISKQIVEMFGGKIGVESELGKGSKFWFTARFGVGDEKSYLLSNDNTINKESEFIMAEETKASKRILLVDDNEINQQVSLALLEKIGFNADIASNGEEALDILLKEKYNLILMDCQMPGMDGYETSRKIRNGDAGELNKNTIIIALTANVLAGDRNRCLEAGMNDYLGKPVKTKELLSKLQIWLTKDEIKFNNNSDKVNEELNTNIDDNLENSSDYVEKTIPECLNNIANEIIDKKSLAQRMLYDENLIKNVLNTFNNISPRIIETLRFAIESENYDLAKEQAHNLKGSAGTISAIQLENLASELENHYINSDYKKASECFKRLEEEYNKLTKEIF